MLLGTFLLLLLISFSIMLAGTRSRHISKTLKLRLAGIRDGSVSMKTGAPLLDLTEGERPGFSVFVGEFASRFQLARTLSRLILHAGSQSSVGSVLLQCMTCGFGAFVLSLLLISIAPVAILAACAGAVLPILLLRYKRGKRLKKFSVAMPDAIDLMARSLRAGHSISASLEVIAEQSPEPLAGEFDRVFQQQRFGLRFRDALLEMADRIPSPDLHFLITAILVQRETGGDLTEILDRTTHVIRERVRIQGEVRVYTAQGRLTGWILSLLPLVLLTMINVISPGYSHLLFTDPSGQKMLYAGGGLIAVGAFLISRIVDVKV